MNDQIHKPPLPLSKTPEHVAMVMDGNLRWGKKHNVSSEIALRQGLATIRPIVKRAKEYGIEYLTFWALSTENWRKRGEVFTSIILNLMRENLKDTTTFDEIVEEDGRINFIGDISAFPADIQEELQKYKAKQPEQSKITINIAI